MPDREPLEFAELPEEILNSLSEFTYGGFILFYFDAEGVPQLDTRADSPMSAIALQKFALDMLNALDLAGRQQILNQVQHDMGMDEEEPPAEEEPGEEEV